MKVTKKTIGVIAVLMLGVFVASSQAANTNFSPANMSGETPFEGEYKSRVKPSEAAAAAAEKGPTFWQKEYERSGLKNTGGRVQGFVRGVVGGVGNPAGFFKKQEEKYLARKRGEAVTSE